MLGILLFASALIVGLLDDLIDCMIVESMLDATVFIKMMNIFLQIFILLSATASQLCINQCWVGS
jgi:hypothetical protein